MTSQSDQFYDSLSEYYDMNATMGYEARTEKNLILKRMRRDFRSYTLKYPFSSALEIGCGPGFDIAWFASKFPRREISGIDVSATMIEMAGKRLESLKLPNAKVFLADERKLTEIFRPAQFDMVYVFFGALNTVEDLNFTVKQIHTLLTPGGHAVLTFVNKWYMREMLVQVMKFNFKTAFARLREDWGGYSPDRHLKSRCYSPAQIKKIFRDFRILERKGYSIFYPAWYNDHKIHTNPGKYNALLKWDEKIQNTFLWSKGEYTLFVMEKLG